MAKHKLCFLVLGGTGSLGQEIVKYISKHHRSAEIRVLSRDEHKQQRLRRIFPKVKFFIGDIRDKQSLRFAFQGVTAVFHVAALKHIDVMEANPIESVKTNVLGTINAAEAAIEFGIKYFMFSSTDKAVDPINAYGFSKALSEKILWDFNTKQSATRFKVYRWGNVIGSEGSFIKDLVYRLRNKQPIPVTDLSMTRFWINISDAVDFVFETYKAKRFLEIPPKMRAAELGFVIEAVAKCLGVPNYRISPTAVRPGEKNHEVLISQHYSGLADSSQDHNKMTEAELLKLLKPKILELSNGA